MLPRPQPNRIVTGLTAHMNNVFTLQQLNYITKDKRSFTFDFESGPAAICGIAGPAGSGKSLLLSLLGGRAKPASGRIYHKGELLQKNFFREEVCWYPHGESLTNDTPREQIRRGNRGSISSIFTEKNLVHFFSNADLPRYLLCESQRKIADILQAAAKKGKILLLDSPDNGLDPQQKMLLGTFLREYHIEQRKSLFIVSSDMNFLAEHCKMIVFLKNGGIYKTVEPEAISEELLGEVFGLQASIASDITSGKPLISFSHPV